MKTPSVTRAIVLANVIVYALLYFVVPALWGPEFMVFLREHLALLPSRVFAGEIWQPVTSTFLHAAPGESVGIMHILFNMICIWSIGLFLERAIGAMRFLALYMVSGLGGSLLVVLLQSDTNCRTMGASGALLGLLGALAIITPNARMLLFFVIPIKARTLAIGIGIFSVVMQLMGTAQGISHWGHLGGLVAGFLFTRYFIPREEIERRFQGDYEARRAAHEQARQRHDEMARRMLERLMRNQRPDTYQRQEKVINPRRDEAPGQTAREPREIYFDPMTGRFYIRDKRA